MRESLRNLRLDRRLLQRRGWISREELERELAALPDVSEKIAPPEEEPADAEPGASSDEREAEGDPPESQP